MTRIFSLFLSDERIVELIRQRDKEILSWLFNKHIHMITKYIRENHGTDYDASEILQDTLVVLWEKIRRGEFALESKLSTYLYAVVKNKWLQELSRRKKYTTLDEISGNPGPEGDALEQLQEKELVEIIKKCLEMLSPLCQKILTLYYYEDKSMLDISALTGLANEDVAKSKKYQCKKELEVLMKSAMQ